MVMLFMLLRKGGGGREEKYRIFCGSSFGI